MASRTFKFAFLALFAGVQSAELSVDLRQLDSEEEWKERPIAKVVNMLKDMQAELEVEGKKDEEMYDEMTCWCETGEKEKVKAIADAKQKIVELTSTIEQSTASAKHADTEIKTHTASIAELSKALLDTEIKTHTA